MSNEKSNTGGLKEGPLPYWLAVPISMVIVAVVLSTVVYICNFCFNPISDDPGDWGVLGDYFGGLLNPIVSIATLAVTLYIATVARKLQFDEQTVTYQPVPYIEAINEKDHVRVSLVNYGSGPIKVIQAQFSSTNPDVKPAKDLGSCVLIGRPFVILEKRTHNGLPEYLPPGREIILIEFKARPVSPLAVNPGAMEFLLKATDILRTVTFELEYSDIFSTRRLQFVQRLESIVSPY